MKLTGVIMPTASAGTAAESTSSGPLQRVANRPIVCHVLDQMQLAGVARAALVVQAWGLDELQTSIAEDGPRGLDVSFVPFGGRHSIDEALGSVADLVGDDLCLVHAADGLPTQPLSELVPRLDGASAAELVAFVHRSVRGSTALATRRLLRNVGHPHKGEALELAGVCLFGPGALRRVGSATWWQDGRLDLAAISEQLIGAGADVSVQPIDGWLQSDGSMTKLLALNRFLLDLLPADAPSAPSAGGGGEGEGEGEEANRIEGPVVVHPTARVESSMIVGPAVIGPGAVVVNAYIGSYTSIGAGVHVEGAEIERSIILPGARITHIGGRLVGSVVGRDALIFRDFSLPRALRMNVGDGGEVALC
jgi:glucose-1-phosphate thymidylyltransferase